MHVCAFACRDERDLRIYFSFFLGHLINKLIQIFSKINGSDLFEVLPPIKSVLYSASVVICKWAFCL